jgi:hypothetical protein
VYGLVVKYLPSAQGTRPSPQHSSDQSKLAGLVEGFIVPFWAARGFFTWCIGSHYWLEGILYLLGLVGSQLFHMLLIFSQQVSKVSDCTTNASESGGGGQYTEFYTG